LLVRLATKFDIAQRCLAAGEQHDTLLAG